MATDIPAKVLYLYCITRRPMKWYMLIYVSIKSLGCVDSLNPIHVAISNSYNDLICL